ncbi:M16 family metallopeptidase [Streptomyces inhibens]|uniref:M16 family metallopeptidase n=1 Tax=Streptomyces inhibens TaxID=2293571 RepID=UPI00402B0108
MSARSSTRGAPTTSRPPASWTQSPPLAWRPRWCRPWKSPDTVLRPVPVSHLPEGSLARRSAAPPGRSGTSDRTTCAGDVITGQTSTTRVAQLDGGLPLLLTPTDARHTAGIALSLGFGSRDDPAGMSGAAHLLGRLIMAVPLEGGPSLGERVEQFGGTWGAVTGAESLTVHARVPADDAPVVAGWMLDALTRPALSDEALGRERRNVTREPVAAEADPAAPLPDAQAAFLAAVFPGHPLGAAVDGTPGGAGRIALGPLLQMHQRALATVPLALACDGNVREAALRSRMSPLAMARAGGVRPRRSPHAPAGRPGPPDPVWPDGPCQLLAGAPAPTATDPRRDAFVLLGHVLGAGPASQMHRRLGTEHGLAPVFRAWARAYSDAGVWCFLAGTDGADGPAVVRTLRAELARLARHGPAPADLDAAVRQARTEVLRTAENGYATVVASHHCVTGTVWSPEAERARLARVTAADVAGAAAAVAEGLRVVVRPDGRARDE